MTLDATGEGKMKHQGGGGVAFWKEVETTAGDFTFWCKTCRMHEVRVMQWMIKPEKGGYFWEGGRSGDTVGVWGCTLGMDVPTL